MTRQRVSSGRAWEPVVGYSRAVRAGGMVFVSGTTAATAEGTPAFPDAYRQARRCLETIRDALAEAGASLADVVRTRIYVTDMALWEDVARAHAEFFGDVRPAATMVGVQALIAPGLLVEIEADAVLGA